MGIGKLFKDTEVRPLQSCSVVARVREMTANIASLFLALSGLPVAVHAAGVPACCIYQVRWI